MSFGYQILGFGAFPSRGVDSFTPTHAAVFDGSSDYLKFSFNEAGNTAKFTLSVWTKRSNPETSVADIIFEARADGSNTGTLYFNTTDIHWQDYDNGVGEPAWRLNSDAVFRDPTAWMNIVIICDTAQSVQANRQRIFVNGVQLTSFSTNTLSSQYYASAQGILSTNPHYLGFDGNTSGSNYYEGYMSEFILLDGIAAEPTTFGEYDSSTGIWVAKDPLQGYAGGLAGTKNIADWGEKNSLYFKFSDSTNLGRNFRPTEITSNDGTYKIDYSIYFDGSDDYLDQASAFSNAPTNASAYTLSMWVKRVNPGTAETFAHSNPSAAEYEQLKFNEDDIEYQYNFNDGGSEYGSGDFGFNVVTSGLYRDPTAWMHMLFRRNAGVADIFVNGVKEATTTAAQAANTNIKHAHLNDTTGVFEFGRRSYPGTGTSEQFSGYLAEIIFLDGAFAEPTDLGGWDANGIWMPVDPSGISSSMTGQAIIPQSTGSTIGTMNTRTSAAFDGNTNQDENNAASHSSALSTATIGKDFGSGNAKVVNEVRVWGYNGGGFTSNASQTCTIAVIGSNTGLGSDEVTLFTSGTISDTTNSNVQNFKFDNTTAYRYVYIKLTQGVSNYFFVAELEFYHETTIGFGTNGFMLQFKGDGTTFDSNADSGGVGADTSGNGRHFRGQGNVHNNRTTDTPTNTSGDNEGNYATWNPIDKHSNVTLSEGNKTAEQDSASGWRSVFATQAIPVTGKWIWETKLHGTDPFGGWLAVGVASHNVLPTAARSATGTILFDYRDDGSDDDKLRIFNQTASVADQADPVTLSNGEAFQFLVDSDAEELMIYTNGVKRGSTVDISGLTKPYKIMAAIYSGGSVDVTLVTNSVDFENSSPDSNYKTLNTANLAAPTYTDPRKYFTPVLYTGTSQGLSVRGCFDSTGTAWMPDWVWIKNRTGTPASAHIYDTVRGPHAYLKSTTNDQEGGGRTRGDVLGSFFDGGFLLGPDASEQAVNKSGDTYVAWCWRAGGRPTADNTGDRTPTSGSVMKGGVAQTASNYLAAADVYPKRMSIAEHGGFSIVSWTGDGTNSDTTIPHGLDGAVEFILTKNRDNTTDWLVKHKDDGLSDGTNLRLNEPTTTTPATSGYIKAAGLTTNTFEFDEGDSNANNFRFNNHRYIAYCFRRTPGLIGIGHYIGGSTNGLPYVTIDDGATGFRPAWLMIKRAAASENWYITDSARDSHNPNDTHLLADSTNTESNGSGTDFLANGFKVRATSNSVNAQDERLIYLAFSDQAFSLQARAR